MKVKIGGDLGDAIFSLPVIRCLPKGPHQVVFADSKWCGSFIRRCPILKELYESQPYISGTEIDDNTQCDLDLTNFRIWHTATTTLVDAQWSEANSKIQNIKPLDGAPPWLSFKEEREPSGKIIIARSPRYNNHFFPWQKVVDLYGKRLQFVGLPEEHATFQKNFCKVKHLKVNNFLELAHHIRNSELFIGNQSSPHAVAMGLGVPIIQETCLEQPDCIFRRQNVQYVSDGGCYLPAVLGVEESVKVESYIQPPLEVPIWHVPPGFWQYPQLPAHTHFPVLRSMVMQLEKCSQDTAHERLMLYNMSRVPDYFKDYQPSPKKTVDEAIRKAFNTNPNT